MNLPLDGTAQKPVPGRIELNLIHPGAEAVVCPEDRQVALGPARVLAGLGRSSHRRGLADAVCSPSATLSLEGLAQGQIDFEQIDRLKRRSLVEHSASRVLHRSFGGRGLGWIGRAWLDGAGVSMALIALLSNGM